MPPLAIKVLGAGRHVGKSCVLIHIGGAYILCDCGIQVTASGVNRFPDLASFYDADTLIKEAARLQEEELSSRFTAKATSDLSPVSDPDDPLIECSHSSKQLEAALCKEIQNRGGEFRSEEEYGTRSQIRDCSGCEVCSKYPLLSISARKKCIIDCIVITHFHVDHLGALPLLTEVLGYEGPIYMTQHTWALGRASLSDSWVTLGAKTTSLKSLLCDVPSNWGCSETPTPQSVDHTFSHGVDEKSRHNNLTFNKNQLSLKTQQYFNNRLVSAVLCEHMLERCFSRVTIIMPKLVRPVATSKQPAGHFVGETVADSESRLEMRNNKEKYTQATTAVDHAALRRIQDTISDDPFELIRLPIAGVRGDCYIEISFYPAGHVTGAVMVLLHSTRTTESVLYTGDYTSQPEKNIPAARLPRISPTVIISEATYASQVRDLKDAAEFELCISAQDCVFSGGNVLIPVPTLGKAQDIAQLMDSFFSKFDCAVRIVTGAGLMGSAQQIMAELAEEERRSNRYRQITTDWKFSKTTNSAAAEALQSLKSNPILSNNEYSSTHPKSQPTIFIVAPKDLNTGVALEVLQVISQCPKSLVLIPGFSPPGTVAYQIINGSKEITYQDPVSRRPAVLQLKCKMRYIPLGAHDDMESLFRFILASGALSVVLMHGAEAGLEILANTLRIASNCPVYLPFNNHALYFNLATPTALTDFATRHALRVQERLQNLSKAHSPFLDIFTRKMQEKFAATRITLAPQKSSTISAAGPDYVTADITDEEEGEVPTTTSDYRRSGEGVTEAEHQNIQLLHSRDFLHDYFSRVPQKSDVVRLLQKFCPQLCTSGLAPLPLNGDIALQQKCKEAEKSTVAAATTAVTKTISSKLHSPANGDWNFAE